MPLRKRILKVTFDMPGGLLVLDESLEMSIIVRKECLRAQTVCEINVVNLTTTMRAKLTEFTAWNKRLAQTGSEHLAYINVKVEAGYNEGGTITVFTGQVVAARLTSPPPSLGVSIQCASRQIDKLKDTPYPPPTDTFKQYVIWAAKEMGVAWDCQTSYDDAVTPGLFATAYTVDALLWALQSAFRPFVVAYVDNDRLVVRDLNKALDSERIVYLEEFIGAPLWTDYGATFRAMFDHRVHLGGLVNIASKLTPGLANAEAWLVYSIDYELTTREQPFYISCAVYPPASD